MLGAMGSVPVMERREGMTIRFSYSTSDEKGNGSSENAEFYGSNIDLAKVRAIEVILKKTREDIYKALVGK